MDERKELSWSVPAGHSPEDINPLRGTYPTHESLISILFEKILHEMAELDPFINEEAPTLFLVYAHNNPLMGTAYAELAQQLISWLKKVRSKLRSDRSPLGLGIEFSPEEDDKQAVHNILSNQLCLLPRSSSEKSVKNVILCCSKVLASYFEAGLVKSFFKEVRGAYSRAPKNARNPIELQLEIQKVVNAYAKKQEFHHVLTELAFLDIRDGDQTDRYVIPIIFDDNPERFALLPGFENSTDIWIGLKEKPAVFIEPYIVLHKPFFRLLGRLYANDLDFVDAFEECYKDCVGWLKKLQAPISREFFEAYVDKQIYNVIHRLKPGARAVYRARQSQGRNAVNRSYDKEVYDEFMKELPLTNPQEDFEKIKALKDTRVEGTCEWLLNLDEYKKWFRQESKLALWLCGPPGIGKTMISLFLAETLREKQKTHEYTLAFYFCDNKNSQRRTATSILRGLLVQLMTANRALFGLIEADYKRMGKRLFDEFDALWTAFRTILRQEDVGSFYLILDALDECDEPSLTHFVKLLAATFGDCTTNQNVNSQLFITSREEGVIKRQLSGVTTCVHIGSAQVEDDLRKYVNAKVRELKLHTGYSMKSLDLISSTLKLKAEGTFLWVHLIISELEQGLGDDQHAANVLQALPNTLQEAYRWILKKIERRDAEKAKFVLQLVVAARLPLTVNELDMAYAVYKMPGLASKETALPGLKDIQRNIYSCCLPLVNIEEATKTVNLVHQSAKDFLLGGSNNDKTADSSTTMDRFASRSDSAQRIPFSVPNLRPLGVFSIPLIFWVGRRHATFVAFSLSTALIYWSISFQNTFWPSQGMPALQILGHRFFSDPWYRVSLSKANLLFLQTIWRYLGTDEFTNGLDIIGRSPENELIPRHLSKEFLDKYCFLAYAAREWQEHAVAANAALGTNFMWFGSSLAWMSTLRDAWLYKVASTGDVTVARLLLEKGADVTVKDGKGRTALHQTAINGHEAMARLLLDNSAEIRLKDKYGFTALHLAVLNQRQEVVRVLLEKGASITAQDDEELRDWHWEPDKSDKVVRSLLKNGMERTLLWAAEMDDTLTVRMLIQQGADIVTKDRHGYTAVHTAALREKKWAAKLLKEDIDRSVVEEVFGLMALHLHSDDNIMAPLLSKVWGESGINPEE